MEKEINIEELQNKIKELEAQNKEYIEGWKRERAGFLNYKKEEMERISGIMKYCAEETILKILPILDNFYIAEREMGDPSTSSEQAKWFEGFLQIKKQIEEFLKSQNVEEIKAVGEQFDPNFHEAVGEEETEETEETKETKAARESGVITEEIQKGYLLNGKVIRPAKVKVSK